MYQTCQVGSWEEKLTPQPEVFTPFFCRETSESKECCHVGMARFPYCSLEISVDIKCSKAFPETKIIFKFSSTLNFTDFPSFSWKKLTDTWWAHNPVMREKKGCVHSFVLTCRFDQSFSFLPFYSFFADRQKWSCCHSWAAFSLPLILTWSSYPLKSKQLRCSPVGFVKKRKAKWFLSDGYISSASRSGGEQS